MKICRQLYFSSLFLDLYIKTIQNMRNKSKIEQETLIWDINNDII